MIMKKEGRDESKQVNSPIKRGLHSLSYVGRNQKKFPPGTKPFLSQDSEIESYARQIAEVASVSFASDPCFKRRRLILANLNIVLEEYLSVVIFDISHSNLSLITSCALHFILRLHYLAYSCYHMCSDLTSEFY